MISIKIKEEYKGVIYITAKDDNGIILESELRIAEIMKLEIITKSRKIEVGNFESIELLAYDNYGNVFSSLEGLPFQ